MDNILQSFFLIRLFWKRKSIAGAEEIIGIIRGIFGGYLKLY